MSFYKVIGIFFAGLALWLFISAIPASVVVYGSHFWEKAGLMLSNRIVSVGIVMGIVSALILLLIPDEDAATAIDTSRLVTE